MNTSDVTTDAHPGISDLGLLLSSHESSFSDRGSNRDRDSLILHVAECLQCQKNLTVLTSLNQSHHTIENTVVNEVQQMLVVDYVHRGFSISRKKLLRQKIKDEPVTLKAMLHYASHCEAMHLDNKERVATQERIHTDVSKKQNTPNPFTMIGHFLMAFKLPFKWSFAFGFSTIYSMCISFLSISLLFIILSDKFQSAQSDELENSPALLANNSVELEFVSNSLDDLSFIYVVEAEKDTSLKQRRGKVKIFLNEKKTLHIGWPVLKNDHIYTLSFYHENNLTEIPDLSLTTTGSFVDLDLKNFESDKRYRWVFSYRSLAKKTFRAKGGFIIKSLSGKN